MFLSQIFFREIISLIIELTGLLTSPSSKPSHDLRSADGRGARRSEEEVIGVRHRARWRMLQPHEHGVREEDAERHRRREEREEHGLVSGSDRTPVAPTNERALVQRFRRIDEPCTEMGVCVRVRAWFGRARAVEAPRGGDKEDEQRVRERGIG